MKKYEEEKIKKMSREDIRDTLNLWQDDEKIITKASQKGAYGNVLRRIKTGELLPTTYQGLCFRGDCMDERNAFELLVNNFRLMDKRKLQVQKSEMLTDHAIKVAVRKGDIMRYDGFGRGVILYID